MKHLISALLISLVFTGCANSIGKSANNNSEQNTGYTWTWTSTAENNGAVTVTLNPPAEILKKMEDCVFSVGWSGASGNGLTIDWGDGRVEPQFEQSLQGKSCTDAVRTHVYTASGDFTVKISSWHPGPTDAPVSDWEGSGIVKIRLAGSKPTALELLGPVAGTEYLYQSLPKVSWFIATSKKVDVKVDLVDDQGTVFASETKTGVAYTGNGSSIPTPNWTIYDSLLRAGKDKFWARIQVLDQGQVVTQKMSGQLLMSALWVNPSQSLVAAQNGLTVSFAYNAWTPNCFSYVIDWGDGTAETSVQGVQPSCPLTPEQKNFSHTYANPGTYTIKVKTNNLDPFRDFSTIVMYEGGTVTVQ